MIKQRIQSKKKSRKKHSARFSQVFRRMILLLAFLPQAAVFFAFVALFLFERLSLYRGGVMHHLYYRKMQYLTHLYPEKVLGYNQCTMVLLVVLALILLWQVSHTADNGNKASQAISIKKNKVRDRWISNLPLVAAASFATLFCLCSFSFSFFYSAVSSLHVYAHLLIVLECAVFLNFFVFLLIRRIDKKITRE